MIKSFSTKDKITTNTTFSQTESKQMNPSKRYFFTKIEYKGRPTDLTGEVDPLKVLRHDDLTGRSTD